MHEGPYSWDFTPKSIGVFASAKGVKQINQKERKAGVKLQTTTIAAVL